MAGLVTGNRRAPLAERGDDLYETPAVAVSALLSVERVPATVWEPACGPGAIVRVLRAAGHRVIATDLVDYGCPDSAARIDFLLEHAAPTIAFHARQDPDSGPVTHPLDTDGSSIGVAYGFEDRGRGDDGRGHTREPSFSAEIASTMNAMKPPSVAFGGNNISGSIDVATAINAHGGPNGRCDFESETFLAAGSVVRRLTPRECERLQGFPDDYTLIPLPLKAHQTRVRWAADGPRYRALGNSMAVPVVRWLLERVDAVDRLMMGGLE